MNEWMNEWCTYIVLYCVLLNTQSASQSWLVIQLTDKRLVRFAQYLLLSLSETVGLIYQSNEETSAHPWAQISLRQSSRVIYETFVCRQSQCTKDCTLINVVAENNRRLNITPLKTPRFKASPLEFTTPRNITRPKRGSNLMKNVSYSKNTPV